jgi:hypothetical protein
VLIIRPPISLKHRAHQFAQAFFQRQRRIVRRFDGRIYLFQMGLDDRKDQRVLAGIVVIQQGLGDLRLAGHSRHGCLVHPLLGKNRRGMIEDHPLLLFEIDCPGPRHPEKVFPCLSVSPARQTRAGASS